MINMIMSGVLTERRYFFAVIKIHNSGTAKPENIHNLLLRCTFFTKTTLHSYFFVVQ